MNSPQPNFWKKGNIHALDGMINPVPKSRMLVPEAAAIGGLGSKPLEEGLRME
ncbi:hypothetical protein [Gorillibacterium sp. sgz5001074]|uniref:hypothetical protein n=1 Tax=Gorillibacterium sp. sgz5001074 TaxID=3446695 RepID=UPI003F67C8EF